MASFPVKWILHLTIPCLIMSAPCAFAFDDVLDITKNAEVSFSEASYDHVRDLTFHRPKDGKLFFGYSQKRGWIRLTIQNPLSHKQDAILDIPSNFNLNQVILYTQHGKAIYRGDHHQNEDESRLISFGHTFPIELEAGINILYLYVYSDDFVNLTIELYKDRETYLKESTPRLAYFLVCMTMTVTMILYSSFLVSAMRERRYVYYIIYNASITYVHYYKAGFFQNIVLLPWNWLADIWAHITHLAIVFAHFFISVFLYSTIKRNEARKLVFKWLNRGYLASTIFYLIGYEIGIISSVILLFTASASAVYIIVLGLKENRIENYLFALSWLFVIVASVFYTLTFIGMIRPTFFSNNLLILGVSIEAVVSGYAIGIQVHRIRSQKVFAFEQFQKLVFPHQISQIGEGVSLIETMPIGAGNAFVISLDIEKSSQIMHARRKEFLEHFMEQCQKIIDENYNPSDKTANAYTIKGVGDGFLCSVGFPFEAPKGLNAADHTIDLAIRFAQAFDTEVKSLDYVEPIHCSIGISHGGVEGYFSKGKVLHYDLYGHAIVTAARYEGLRKALYKGGLSNNVLILQKTVFRSLSASKRSIFKEIDLATAGIAVRDDPGADKAYTLEVSRADEIPPFNKLLKEIAS